MAATNRESSGFTLPNRVLNPATGAILRSRAGRLFSRLAALEYRGRRSGQVHRLVVQAAPGTDASIVVVVGWPERKAWWRNFSDGPHAATAWFRGARSDGTAEVLTGAERDAALDSYRKAFGAKAADRAADWPVIRLTPGPDTAQR